MSGTGANLPVAIRLTGGPEAEAAFQRVENAAQRSMGGVARSTAQASGGMRNFGQVAGQAGFQIQDFATQVSMGQNALTAFSVQFAQFAGVFGTAGAIAGAVVAVGAIGLQLASVGQNANAAAEAAEDGFNRTRTAGELLATLLRQVNDLYMTQEQRAAAAAEASRRELQERARGAVFDASQDVFVQQFRQASAEQRLAAARADEERERRLVLADFARQGRQPPASIRTAATARVEQAASDLLAARTDAARAQQQIAEGNALLERLSQPLPEGGSSREPAARTRAVRENNDAAREQLALQREIAAAVAAADTPFEAYQRRLEAIADLATRAEDAGQAIDPERLLRMGEAAQAALDRALNRVGESTERTTGAARDLGLTFSSAFEDAIVKGKSFSDVLQGIGQDLVRIATRRLITEPLGNAVSGALPGITSAASDFFSSIIGGIGARADGGPVSGGRPYIVGERGPELFVPGATGTVVPNHALGGIAFSPTYNIDARGADMGVLQRVRAEMAAIAQASVAQLKEEVSRGGNTARAFGRR